MKMFMRHIAVWSVVFALLPCLLACHRDDPDFAPVSEATKVGLSFKIPVVKSSPEDGFEKGSTYENYVDFASGDYRIYFFGTDDLFIARFTPSGVIEVPGSDYTEYYVDGVVPSDIANLTTFKVVVLGNWGTYNDDAMNRSTTIGNLCSMECAKYKAFTDFDLGPGKNLIPFYGVQEFSGVKFIKDQRVELPEDIFLLRAMAKVEVVLQGMEGLDCTEMNIHRYNSTGISAPLNAYKRADYYNGYDWNNDFAKELNLVENANDSGEKSLSFKRVSVSDDGKEQRWVAYVPEYRNKGVGDDFCSIRLKYDFQTDVDAPYEIYFAEYKDGKTNNEEDNNRIDIARNCLYRYYVTVDKGRFVVRVLAWDGVFKNDYTFGE